MVIILAYPVVSSVSQGDQRVNFTYTLNTSGQVKVASTYLFDKEEAESPTSVVRYEYNNEGRLTRVLGPLDYVASLQ